MIKLVSRYLTLFFIGVGLTLGSALVLFYFTGIPHEIVRTITEKEMRKVLNQPVTIEKVSGNLIFSATLHNIRLYNKPGFPKGTVIKIGELVAHYNVLDGIRFKGDFAKASTIVEVNDTKVYMLRDTRDQWNVLHILPPPNPKAPPPTFTGKLLFQNMSIYFRDEKGWGDTHQPFHTNFTRLYGVMDFSRLHKTKLYLTGQLSDKNDQALKITGLFNTLNGAYDLVFSTIHTDVKTWGNYVFNRSGYTFNSGQAAVKGRIRSKDHYVPHQIPMWYDIKIKLSNGTFQVPYLKTPFTQLKGSMQLYYGLQKNKKPSQTIQFLDTTAKLNTIPVEGKGTLDLIQHGVDLHMEAKKPFSAEQIGGAVYGIAGLGFKGMVTAGKVSVLGKMESPKVTAKLESPLMHFSALAGKNLVLETTLKDKVISLNVTQGTVLNTPFTGRGTVNLKESPATFHLFGKASSMVLNDISPELAKYGKGSCVVDIEAKGQSSRYDIKASFSQSTVTIYGQRLSRLEIDGQVNPNRDFELRAGKLWINFSQTPLVFTGVLSRSQQLSLAFKGQAINIADLDRETPSSRMGKLDTNGRLELALSKAFWEKPLSTLSLQLAATIQDYTCLGEDYPAITAEGDFHDGEVLLRRFSAKIGGGTVECTGTFKDLKPDKITLNVSNINVGKNKLLQRFIGGNFKPFSGFLSAKASLSRNPTPGPASWGWLKDFTILGDITLSNASIRNQPVDHLELHANWSGHNLEFNRAFLKHGQTSLSLNGTMNADKILDLTINPASVIELSDFEPLFSKVGKLSGKVALNGHISGTGDNPYADLTFSAGTFKSNFLEFDKLEGHVSYKEGKLGLQPISFTKNGDTVKVVGELDLLKLLKPNVAFADLDYQLDVSCTHIGLTTLTELIEGIWKEVRIKSLENDLLLKEKITNSNRDILISPETTVASPGFDKSVIPLYTAGKGKSALSFYGEIYKRFEDIKKPEELGLKDLVRGQITAQVSAKSRPGKPPIIVGRIELNALETSLLKAQSIFINIDTQHERVLFASKIEKGTWGTKSFDKFLTTGQLDQNGILRIGSSEITVGGDSHKDILTGSVDVLGKHNFALDAVFTFHKNDVGLLSFISPAVNDIQNKGVVQLALTGSLKEPLLNAKQMVFKDAKVVLNPEVTSVTSPMAVATAAITIENNVVVIKALQLDWQGPDTQKLHSSVQAVNRLDLKGKVRLRQFTFVNPSKFLVDTDIAVKDTAISIQFPKLYKGDIALNNLKIYGTYTIPINFTEKKALANRLATDTEDGPVISGDVHFSNGEVVVPTLGKRNPKPSFLLDINCTIKKDVTLTGSLIDQDLLNTFGVELDPTSVVLLGSLNYPKPQTSLTFGDGSVKIFNRIFTLLSTDKQRIYFAGKQYKTLRNTVSFTVREDKALGELKNVPSLELIAYTVIDPDPADIALRPNDPDASKYKHILVSINGPIYDLSSYTFDKYVSDINIPRDQKVTFRTTASLSNSVDSTGAREFDKAIEMLLPDLYDTTGTSRLDSQTTRVLNKLSESQLNTVIRQQIRPIEKQIAKNIGIYDIKVDYNAGGALLKATNIQGFGADNPSLGVNFFQNLLSDQLFLRVKTNLDSKTQKTDSAFQISEVELTYYFYRNLSANYSNVLNDNGIDYRSKAALKYRYEF
jgi:hypothetical protein